MIACFLNAICCCFLISRLGHSSSDNPVDSGDLVIKKPRLFFLGFQGLVLLVTYDNPKRFAIRTSNHATIFQGDGHRIDDRA